MAESTNHARLLNPWVLHLQKLGLELKCPLCLNLYNRPMLLPCNHMFCNFCLPKAIQKCPVCEVQYSSQDLRPMPYMDNLVTIYGSLDATFCASLCLPVSSDAERVSVQCLTSVDKLRKDAVETSQEENWRSGPALLSLMTNKRVQVPFNHSVENGFGKTGNFNKCMVLINGEGGKFENLEIDMNQGAQSSLGSPPSFGDIKGLDDDCSDHGSEKSPEKYSAKRVKNNSDDRTGPRRNDSPESGYKSCDARDIKRQKKLNYGFAEMGVKNDGHYLPVVSSCVNSTVSNSGLDTVENRTVCGFCQSTKISQVTGPMLHYANGKLVVGDDAFLPDVIHVHRKCIEWAPQVYYVGETVKNLKKELARGAKLKCSSCGLKGAALGCYEKSCRKSFHVPCAVEVLECRWDCENYLVLCPSHCSLKFPNEKSNSEAFKKQTVSTQTQMTSQRSKFWASSPNGVKELVLCGSALSAREKFLLVKFASMSGVTVSKFWKPNVTHVIAATDVNGACSRTMKVLMAILNGKWVLKIDWIKACMEAMRPVDEEPYEVGLDNHGCLDGPKTGRLRTMDNAPKLFSGLTFYLSGDFVPGYKEDLQRLITAAGGTILKSKENLVALVHDAKATASTILVVYNLDPPQGCKLGDEVSILWKRLEEAEVLAAEIGSGVIGHTWLLESIAACKLQPLAS
ncbi:hypothetical protein L1049_027079 [Liquidambar formosana]|uniref:RING-type E3 ubiquitin transferase BRCA1 n=1 Tax=Liquidambar formosana TaxID=63359 RepID=A0AAP0R4E7_LIQFO